MRGSAASSKFIDVAILLYVHLWILEGFARKTIPGANEILYFGRDGLAVLAIVVAVAYGRLRNAQLAGLALAMLIVLWTCLIALSGAESPSVWVVGVRSYIAPLLFVFLFSLSGTAQLMRSIRAAILIQLPVQALVVVVQVTTPADSVWNRMTTGEEAYFLNDGIARASGTFSAPAGLLGFVLLAVALALASIVSSVGRQRWLSGLGLISAIVIGSLSGSRGTVLVLVLLVCGFLFWILTNGTIGRFLLVVFIGLGSAGLFFVISASLPEVVEAFSNRVQDASQHEDTASRIAFTLLGFVDGLDSFLGAGAGTNSQAGMALGADGPWIENESLRWVTELGVLGLALALFRLGCAVRVLCACIFKSSKLSPFRFMLGVALSIVLVQGTITQNPSSQGAFSILLALFLWGGDASCDTKE